MYTYIYVHIYMCIYIYIYYEPQNQSKLGVCEILVCVGTSLLSIGLSVRLVCLSVGLSVCLSVCLPACLSMFFWLSVCLSPCLHARLSVGLIWELVRNLFLAVWNCSDLVWNLFGTFRFGLKLMRNCLGTCSEMIWNRSELLCTVFIVVNMFGTLLNFSCNCFGTFYGTGLELCRKCLGTVPELFRYLLGTLFGTDRNWFGTGSERFCNRFGFCSDLCIGFVRCDVNTFSDLCLNLLGICFGNCIVTVSELFRDLFSSNVL